MMFGMRVELCDTTWKKMKGLMFRRGLDHVLLFVNKKESRINMAIHSFFVFFPFDAIYLDSRGMVVDAETITPFRMNYTPSRPAQYLAEAPAGTIKHNHVRIGTRVKLPFAKTG